MPKAFLHAKGKLTGMSFEKVKAVYDDKGRRSLVPTGEPEQAFECDDVLVAVGQENAFPWIERDVGVAFDKSGLPVVDKVTFQSSVQTCSSAAIPPSARRTSSGPWRTGTTRRSPSTSCCHGEDVR